MEKDKDDDHDEEEMEEERLRREMMQLQSELQKTERATVAAHDKKNEKRRNGSVQDSKKEDF